MKTHGNPLLFTVEPTIEAILNAVSDAMIITSESGIIQLLNGQTCTFLVTPATN